MPGKAEIRIVRLAVGGTQPIVFTVLFGDLVNEDDSVGFVAKRLQVVAHYR